MSEKDEKDGLESVHSSVSASESGKFSHLVVLRVIFESKLMLLVEIEILTGF